MAAHFDIGLRHYQRYETGEAVPEEFKMRKMTQRIEFLEKLGKLPPLMKLDAPEARIEYKPSKQIPIFELDVSASNIQLFQDSPEIIAGYMSFPGFDDCDFGLTVRGDSMYSTYKNGSVIACKKIGDMEIIQYGEAYLIITSEQRMVKRLQKGTTKEYLLCKSDNPSTYEDGRKKFEDFEIHRSKILHLYLVKGEANRSQI